MAEGIKESYTNFFLSLLVVFCIIAFAFNFEQSNNVSVNNSIMNSPIFAELNSSISQMVSNEPNSLYSNQSRDMNASSLGSSTISFGWIIWNGIIGFGRTVIALPIAILSGMREAFGLAFGTTLFIIFDIIALVITVNLIILIVRFFRQGI